MKKYALRPPERIFTRFASLNHFEASASLRTYFELGNTFGYNSDLIKELACTGYHPYISIQMFFSVIEVIHSSQLNMQLVIALKFVLVCILSLLRYLSSLFNL